MSKISKQLLQEAGIKPKLRLGNKTEKGVVSTGKHFVKLIADKIVSGKDFSGKEVEYVRYLLEENGEQKIYQTKKLNENGELSYLVQRFAEFEEGTDLVIEMKKRGPKNYVSVEPVGSSHEVEVSDEDITDEVIEL